MPQLKNNIFEDIQDTPKEHYTFSFDRDSVVPVYKKYMGSMKKRMVGSIISGLILIIIGILSKGNIITGFGIGGLLISVTGHIKVISSYKKLFTKRMDMMCGKSIYDYTLYEDFLIVWISCFGKCSQRTVACYLLAKLEPTMSAAFLIISVPVLFGFSSIKFTIACSIIV